MKRAVMLLAAVSALAVLSAGCGNRGVGTGSGHTSEPVSGNAVTSSVIQSGADGSTGTDEVPAGGRYRLLLYDNMSGGYDDTVTERAGNRITDSERIKEDGIGSRTETLFGNTVTLDYDETLRSRIWVNVRVDYTFSDKAADRLVLASFDSVSGALMAYTDSRAGDDRGYLSEVNGKSGEAEFLAYAKKLVSQYSPVDGCEAEITTEIFEYDASGGYYRSEKQVDGFVNNTEDDPDFYAIYHITFYRTIDGVRRFDTNVIEINSTGEVHRACFNMRDELYAGFADEKVDLIQAEGLVRRALSQFIPTESTVEIVPSLAATNDGELWLLLETFVGYDDGTSGYIYTIKLSDTAGGAE